MAAAPFAISLKRSEAIDFCGLVGGSGTSILVRYPTTTLSSFGMIMTFSYQVNQILYSIISRKWLPPDK
jgi:hypothetical protein